MKKMRYSEFRKKHLEKPVECINDRGLAEMVNDLQKEQDGFKIIFKCNKCGSFDVCINGENGIDYGEYTGYSEGSNVIKCKSCGNAKTVWK